MCLIIYRPGGVELDRNDFETAVLNNPDGWGLSTPDVDGRLYTIREVPKDSTDADQLYTMLHTELRDDPVMVHLRYTTAGDTVLRNAHPFPILERDTDGIDLRMCHNGTLGRFSPGTKDPNQWESDTRVFVRTVVRPLAKRFVHSGMVSPDELLDDPLFNYLIDEQLTAKSVITFMDGNGEFRTINGKGNGGDWEKESGCYFSNDYSFDPSHRVYQWPVHQNSSNVVVNKNTSTNTGTTTAGNSGTITQTSSTKDTHMSDVNVKPFVDEWGELFQTHTLDEILQASDDTIDLIVSDEDVSRSFIMQLLNETAQLATSLKLTKETAKREEQGRKKAELEAYNLNQRVQGQTAWILDAKKKLGENHEAA